MRLSILFALMRTTFLDGIECYAGGVGTTGYGTIFGGGTDRKFVCDGCGSFLVIGPPIALREAR